MGGLFSKMLKCWMILIVFFYFFQFYWFSGRLRQPHLHDLKIIKPPSNKIENLPYIYFVSRTFEAKFNETCARFPHFHDVVFTNDHWQTQKTSNGTFHLLSAYLDDRPAQWMVRILGLFDQLNPSQTFYCQIWGEIESERPDIVLIENVQRIFAKNWTGYHRRGIFQPYVINCPLPQKRVPMSVSLVEFACDNPTNSLRVNYEVGNSVKKNFFVCVKGLNFPYEDRSIRLVEWIELLFILGADMIDFYVFKNHPQIVKVLDHYTSQKKITVHPHSLVGGTSNSRYLQDKFLHEDHLARRLQEVLTYTDCFYRNYKKYKYAVTLDIDEVLVPSKGLTWAVLMRNLRWSYPRKISYVARNVYFFNESKPEGIPSYMYMLRHVHRTRNFSRKGHFVKGFHDTTKVVSLHNHVPIDCVGGINCWAKKAQFNVSMGYLHHYRVGCPTDDIQICQQMNSDLFIDTQLWHYKDELIRRVNKVGSDLGLLKCENKTN